MESITVAAVVFARADSVGLPDKHLRIVGDRPLIAWPCDAAVRVCPHATFVSTNDSNIAIYARSRQIGVIWRPEELATPTAIIDDAWRHAALYLLKRFPKLKYLVCLEGNTIYRRWIIPDLLDTAERTGCDFVRCLMESRGADHPDWQHELTADGRMIPLCDTSSAYRQGLPLRYKWADGPVLARVRSLIELPRDQPRWCIRGDNRAVIVEPADFLHVDLELDLLWAEFVIARLPPPD